MKRTMDIRQFLNDAKSFEEIVEKLAELAAKQSESATADLSGFLLVKDGNTYDTFAIPALACRGFLAQGEHGVRTMATLLSESEGRILPSTIVECIWYAAHGELAPVTGLRTGVQLPNILLTRPTEATISAARSAFHEFVITSQTNQETFDLLVHFMNTAGLKCHLGNISEETIRNEVFGIIRESSIKISKSLLQEFEELLLAELNEEEYQRFLASNPVLLDPLSSKVIPKQALGVEFKTDYMIQRLDSQYFAVEIEKPQDLIFTRVDDFAAPFTHAFGQVIDFLEWVEAHAEYARHLMPGISSPRGMLVMGMRRHLTTSQAAKLRRLSINTPNIDIYTFDDILQRGRSLYSNIHKSATDV